jgi:hypothetical protein
MCTGAIWIQEIKLLFNAMKILIIVFEFAMYSLELEIKFENKIYFRPTYPIFFTTLAETQHFFAWPYAVDVANQPTCICQVSFLYKQIKAYITQVANCSTTAHTRSKFQA